MLNRATRLNLITAPDRMEFFIGGERIAAYRTGPENPGFTGIFAPEGRAVTRMERGDGLALWCGHGDVNGISFGVEPKKEKAEADSGLARFAPDLAAFRQKFERNIGRIVPTETTARRGSQSIGFQQARRWLAPDDTLILHDVFTARLLAGPADGVIFDLYLELNAPEDSPVVFGPSQDALLQMQAATAFFPLGAGQFRNSLGEYGMTELSGRGAAWLAGIGVVSGQTIGFAWLDHPGNPTHPPAWSVTENGAVGPAPFGWQRLTLEPNRSVAFRYRLLVHQGYVDQGWADARMTDFIASSVL